jgi:hypothetical protein
MSHLNSDYLSPTVRDNTFSGYRVVETLRVL